MAQRPHKAKASSGATILQVIPRLDSGGAERSACEIAAGVAAAGATSLVASAGGRLVERLEREGSRFIKLNAGTKNPALMLANIHRLVAIIRRYHVSLIHARSRAPAWSALAAARLCRIPFVTTYHGAHAPARWPKTVYNGVMARGDITIANSRYMAERIAADHGADPAHLVTIYRGVDLDAFDPATIGEDRKQALRAAWGLEAAQRVILVPARLSPRKGQETVIRALAGPADGAHEAICIMVGDDQGRGGYADSLRQLSQQLGLNGRVRLVGHCADMPTAYALSDLTLLPSSEPEAFGRVAPEAQAMGSLVIATDLGGAAETVLVPPQVSEAERTGWRVPPSDAAALARAIGEALHIDPARRERINHAARRHVERNFSLNAMVFRTLEVYDRLLAGGFAEKRKAQY